LRRTYDELLDAVKDASGFVNIATCFTAACGLIASLTFTALSGWQYLIPSAICTVVGACAWRREFDL